MIDRFEADGYPSAELRAMSYNGMISSQGVLLSSATNVRTGCIVHIAMLASPSIYAGVRDFVR
jgi:hypothetical protein